MSALGTPFTDFPYQSFIMLGPFASPGVARVRGASSIRNWEIKQSYGTSGAAVVFVGTGLAKFEVDIDIWLPEHFIAWDYFASVALLKPIPPLGVGSALGITHPLINAPPLGITSVVVEEVTQFVQNSKGLWTCTIKFIEFRAPVTAVARVMVATPQASSAPVAAKDLAEQKILELGAQRAASKAQVAAALGGG